MRFTCFRIVCAVALSLPSLTTIARAQEPIDLFSNAPKLADGYIRVGVWNLRHINLEGDAENILAGATEKEDFAILISTFGQAIRDLGLDVVGVVEVQPRKNEEDRLAQIRGWLNGDTGPWLSDQTDIKYDNPDHPFSNLQFGLLWNSKKVTIDPAADELLNQLRQPRDDAGALIHKRMRAPWLAPVTCKHGNLKFDLMIVHFKSGGSSPQAEEVEAVAEFIKARQSKPDPRHLILCGDYNIRPDQFSGRSRLKALSVPSAAGNLMRVLTVENIAPNLSGWDDLDSVPVSAISPVLPFTHFNAHSRDTFLDHLAISKTLDEVFDHPVAVKLHDGTTDLRPGIQIAYPQIPEERFVNLTDHLPVVLTLRTNDGGIGPVGPASLSIFAAEPNPPGDDEQLERVILFNGGNKTINLKDWKIGDSTGNSFWLLTEGDGKVDAGKTIAVIRQGRPMWLNNSGDTIKLFAPGKNEPIDVRTYGEAKSGRLFQFAS